MLLHRIDTNTQASAMTRWYRRRASAAAVKTSLTLYPADIDVPAGYDDALPLAGREFMKDFGVDRRTPVGKLYGRRVAGGRRLQVEVAGGLGTHLDHVASVIRVLLVKGGPAETLRHPPYEPRPASGAA
jgi:hypothetical protein